MNMNFKEAYKREVDLIKPDSAFLENMIVDLQSGSKPKSNFRVLRLTTIIASSAAVICLVAAGAIVLSNNFQKQGILESEPMVVGDADAMPEFYMAEEREESRYDDGYFAGRSSYDSVVDTDFDVADDEAVEFVEFEAPEEFGASDNSEAEVAGAGIESDRDLNSANPTSDEDRYALNSSQSPWMGHPLAEAMYKLILEILKVIAHE